MPAGKLVQLAGQRARFLNLPDDLMLFAGMSLGYRDPDHPLNNIRTAREPFEVFAEMRGFE